MKRNKRIDLICYQALTSYPFIERDFDALTLYELISKLIGKINEIIPAVNDLDNTIEEKVTEILNEWLADGTLDDLVFNLFYVVPKSYGAEANGITDDLQAFKDMLADAISSGKKIYIPEGDYYLSEPVIISGDLIADDAGNYPGKHVIITGEAPATLGTMTRIVNDYFSILIKENSPTEYWWLQGAAALSDGTPYILARDEVETNGYILKLSKDYSTLDDSWTALIYHGNSCAIVNDVYMLVAPNVANGNTLQVLNLTTKQLIGSISFSGLNQIHGVAWDPDNNMLWLSAVSGTVSGQSGNVFAYYVNDIANLINGGETAKIIKVFNLSGPNNEIEAAVAAYPYATTRMYQNIFYANNALFGVWTLRNSNNRNVGTMILRYNIMTGDVTNAYYMANPAPDAEIESVIIKSGDVFPAFDCVFNFYDADTDEYQYIILSGVINGNMIVNTDPSDNIIA